MSEEFKEKAVDNAKGLSDFLEVDFTISIFGHPIVSWHFPPKRKS